MKKDLFVPEILSPAGSMEALKAAVHSGADAVYLAGNRFGARAYADNFDDNALISAIEYCHLYGVKVYLAINTLFRNEEIKELFGYLLPLYEAGVDAVIVQDLGVMKFVHDNFKGLPVHASTQMTITSRYAYSLLKNYGVTRIVPARELSLAEISALKDEDSPELEVFVQGALCYCYSGACLMSSVIGGRSGNRGRCAQPCRLPYKAYDGETKLSDYGDYILSPKDLCGLESVGRLINAGVDSFKIEGRMKRPEYVSVCTKAYREVTDAYVNNEDLSELIKYHRNRMAGVFNRGGFTKGYFDTHNGREMMSMEKPGNVALYDERLMKEIAESFSGDKCLSVAGNARFHSGEKAKFIVSTEINGTKYEVKIDGGMVDKADKRPVSETEILGKLNQTGGTNYRFDKLEADVSEGAFINMKAVKDLRRNALSMLEDKVLSASRRDISGLKPVWDFSGKPDCGKGKEYIAVAVSSDEQYKEVCKKDFIDRIYIELQFFDMKEIARILENREEKEYYIILPPVMRESVKEDIDEACRLDVNGIVVRSLDEFAYLKSISYQGKIVTDYSLYVMNDYACHVIREFYPEAVITMSVELNKNQLKSLMSGTNDSEMITYGYQQLMVSTQCVRKNVKGCDKENNIAVLKDRYNKTFTAKSVCKYCYNLIYNGVPTVLFDVLKNGDKPRCGMRFQFTIENKEEVQSVMRAFENGVGFEGEYTRGHFKRGVE